MRGLYAIVDTRACATAGVSVPDLAEAVLAGGARAVQLRAKAEGARDTLALLRAVAQRCREAGALSFANDRPDLALLAGCDGVHVGQADLPPAEVATLAARVDRRLLVGASTHDAGELDAALDAPLDYVAIGPVYGTTSKDRPEPTVGEARAIELAERARARRPALARVAIGGIDAARAPRLAASFDAVAVIGALLPPGRSGADALRAARERAAEIVGAMARAGERSA